MSFGFRTRLIFRISRYYNKVLNIPLTAEQLQRMLDAAGFGKRKDVSMDEFIAAVRAGHFDSPLKLSEGSDDELKAKFKNCFDKLS